MLFVMVGLMGNVKKMMKILTYKNLLLEDKKVFGQRKILKTFNDYKKRVEWQKQVMLKLKEQSKMVDGKLHMIHSQQCKFLKTSLKQ